MAKRPRRYIEKVINLRTKLWPDLHEKEIWYRKDATGFTTIPRTLSLVMAAIDDMTKGAPASHAYFELWCRAYDEMYVSLGKQEELASSSGFFGQRAKRTWQDRIKKLAELGFIRTAEGSAGKFSHAVILNPHIVLKRLKDKNTPGLTQARYNMLIERGNEIGATDIDIADPKRPAPTPKKISEENPFDDEIPF